MVPSVLEGYGIELFEVLRDFRGQGIGTHILQEWRKDCPELVLTGYPASTEAGRFWRRVGLL